MTSTGHWKAGTVIRTYKFLSDIEIYLDRSRLLDLIKPRQRKRSTGVLKPPSKPGTSEGSQKVWGYRWGYHSRW